jgi:hypothetical protein
MHKSLWSMLLLCVCSLYPMMLNQNQEVCLSLYSIRHRVLKTFGDLKCKSAFLNSVLVGGEFLAQYLLDTRMVASWIRSRRSGEGSRPCPAWNRFPVSQSIARHCTHYTLPLSATEWIYFKMWIDVMNVPHWPITNTAVPEPQGFDTANKNVWCVTRSWASSVHSVIPASYFPKICRNVSSSFPLRQPSEIYPNGLPIKSLHAFLVWLIRLTSTAS